MARPIRVNGDKIAEVRIRAGLTQSALAERVGVNRSYINRIESGYRSGTPATLLAIADALGCTLDDITDRVAA